MTNKFNGSWINFYTEFANALLKYRNNRQELIRIIKKVFESVDMKLPKLEKDNWVIDIDPFTVFALFNKNLTDLNRKKILRGFADIFSIDGYDIESFDGIPILNPLKATFYCFVDERNDKDIDNLWALFEMALNFSDDPNQDNKNKFISCYDSVVAQKGVSWNITMGLFWIRPYLFINLDSRNREFICDKKYFPEDFINILKAYYFYVNNCCYKTIFLLFAVIYVVSIIITFVFGISCIMIRFGKSKQSSLWFFKTEDFGGLSECQYLHKIKNMTDEAIMKNLAVEVYKLNIINNRKMRAGKMTMVLFSISCAAIAMLMIMVGITYLVV